MDNITIIADKNFSDYHLGFEVQSPDKTFISWDTTYEEVISLPCVEDIFLLDTDYEIYDYYYFKYPVRVGNLIIPRLEFRLGYQDRSDVAVREYFSSTINLSENEKLYEKIKIKLTEDLDPKQIDSDLKRGFFHYEGILFTIFFYEDDNQLAFYMTNTNAREYS